MSKISVVEAAPSPASILSDESKLFAKRTTLLVCHGEKGGVGKSFAASLAASTALHRGLRIHVIETDSAVPDVAPRFMGRPGAGASKIALDRGVDAAETVGALLAGVENLMSVETPAHFVVINAPAGASGVLDGFADIFSAVATALDLDLAVAFLVDDSTAVLPRIEASISSGLLSIASARRAFVYAGWKGDAAKFPVAASSARAAALESGVLEFGFPGLNPASLLQTVKKSNRPFYDFLPFGDPALKIVEKSLLARWLASCEPLSDWLIGSTHG